MLLLFVFKSSIKGLVYILLYNKHKYIKSAVIHRENGEICIRATSDISNWFQVFKSFLLPFYDAGFKGHVTSALVAARFTLIAY